MLSAVLLPLEQILFNALLELVNGVVLAHILGEFIVKSGELLDLDLVELDLEHCVLGGKLGSVLRGEGHVNVEFVADAVADYLLLKAGDKGTRAEGEVIFLSLAALECLAVDKALEVDNGDIAVLGCSVVNVNYSCASLEHMLDLVIDFLGGDLRVALLGGEALVCLEGYFGLNGDVEAHLNALFGIHLLNVNIAGMINGSDACFVISGLNGFGEDYLERILIEYLLAIELLDHHKGSLALAEAGDGDGLSLLHVCLLDGSLEVLGRD